MRNVSKFIRNKILSHVIVQRLNINEAQVVCVLDSVVIYGDVIIEINSSISRKNLQHRYVGAKVCFGDAVYIVFKVSGSLNIVHGKDCHKEFPFKEYESPIKL